MKSPDKDINQLINITNDLTSDTNGDIQALNEMLDPLFNPSSSQSQHPSMIPEVLQEEKEENETPAFPELKPPLHKQILSSFSSLYTKAGDTNTQVTKYICTQTATAIDTMKQYKIPEIMAGLTLIALVALPTHLDSKALTQIALGAGGALAISGLTNQFFSNVQDNKLQKFGLFISHEIAKLVLSNALKAAFTSLFYTLLMTATPAIGATAALAIATALAVVCTSIAMKGFEMAETKIFETLFKNNIMKDIFKQDSTQPMLNKVPETILKQTIDTITDLLLPSILAKAIQALSKTIIEASQSKDQSISPISYIVNILPSLIFSNSKQTSDTEETKSFFNTLSNTALGKAAKSAVPKGIKYVVTDIILPTKEADSEQINTESIPKTEGIQEQEPGTIIPITPETAEFTNEVEKLTNKINIEESRSTTTQR